MIVRRPLPRALLPALVAGVLLVATIPVSSAGVACLPHPPIDIRGDEGPTGFIDHDPLSGAPFYRPGSGVRAGSGTADDPYVIEAWCITPAGPLVGITTAISLRDTSAHVILRDLTIGSAVASLVLQNVGIDARADVGVRLDRVADVTVEHNQILDAFIGVDIQNTTAVTLRANEIAQVGRGIAAKDSTGLVIEQNFVHDVGTTAISATSCPGITLRANDIIGGIGYDVFLSASDASLVEGNVLQGGFVGIFSIASNHNTITRNVIVGSASGMRVDWSTGNEVHDNFVTQTFFGIRAESTTNARFHHNTLVDTWIGFGVRHSDTLAIEHNDVEGSQIGARFETVRSGDYTLRWNNFRGTITGIDSGWRAGVVDARENWWGCGEGPGAEGCAGTQGSVLVSPWLTSPNEDAGVRA